MMPRTSRHDHESDDDDYERDDNRAHAAAAGVIRGGDGSDDDGAEMSEGGRGGRARGGRDRNGGEEEDRRSRKERKKKTKPKKVRVMEASGQTDQDRRVLRTQQRKLQSKIVNSEAGADIENPNADAFESIREENNRLWDDVRYTREAVLDGDNLELISRRARNQVDRLVQVRSRCLRDMTGNQLNVLAEVLFSPHSLLFDANSSSCQTVTHLSPPSPSRFPVTTRAASSKSSGGSSFQRLD